MYRFIISFILLAGILISNLNLIIEARTVVTRKPVYGSYYNRPSRGFRHSRYRHPARYNNYNRLHNPRYYNSYPQRRFFNNRGYYTTSSLSDLSALEKYTLNKSYSRDSDLARLERLEMEAFGAIQNGDINRRYDNVRSAILSRPKQNYKTSFWRNIGNYFGGQMTGFTPSFTPSFTSSFDNDPFFSNSSFGSTPYPTTYGNNSVSQYSTPFGSGYRLNNYGAGSGCGVKILD